jgi:alpha-1,4-digalacturonate transport system permease protein
LSRTPFTGSCGRSSCRSPRRRSRRWPPSPSWRWNDYLWPFLAINSEEKWTVQLALANYVGQWDINWPRLLSMSVLSVIPMLLVFLALQRFFMSGLLAGAVKE